LSLYSPPKTMIKPPPSHVLPIRIYSPKPPTPPKPLFGWLLRRSIEQRPSKTGAPPISQYFDGRHFGAPNKGTSCSGRELGHSVPAVGSGGAATPWFGAVEDDSMEISGKAAGSSAAAHLVWVFGVEREENRDGGRETMIPLFECPRGPFMILLQKHLIWMVEVINNRGRYTYYLSY